MNHVGLVGDSCKKPKYRMTFDMSRISYCQEKQGQKWIRQLGKRPT